PPGGAHVMSDAVAERPETLPEDLRAVARPPSWLRAAADGSELASALTRRVPEIASGELELRGCDVDRVRIKSYGCSGRYRVGVSSGRAGPERIIELHGELIPPGRPQPRASASEAFGEAGWRRWVPELRMMMTTEPPDTVLEAMPALTDAQAAPELVERAIRTASPRYAGFRAGSCRPHVARYKPGSRCTVVYDLEFPPG